MRSTATVRSSAGVNKIILATGERTHSFEIPPKPSGFGSSASGGELLMLALATCYCNDIYREAAKLGIEVTHIEAECGAAFPAEGGRRLRSPTRCVSRPKPPSSRYMSLPR